MNRSLAGLVAAAVCSILAACAASEPAALHVAAKPIEPVCPSGSGWNGTTCVRTLVVNEVTCPAGSTWDGAKCVGTVLVDCPAGTRFVDGSGCVAELAQPQPVPPPPAPAPSPSPGPPAPDKRPCACSAGDLMCLMKCQAGAPVNVLPPAQTGSGKDFDKGAAMTTLAAAASSAKSCKGVPGTAIVRVVFEASGRVSSASLQGPPFAGTPQGGCIAAVFRNAKVPPFDGAPVAVSKSVSIP